MSKLGMGLEQTRSHAGLDQGGDEFVRILSQLTVDVERFDSMIRNQRHLLQKQVADRGAINDRLIRRQSRRISANAAEIAMRTRGALAELLGMSSDVQLHSKGAEHQDAGEWAEGRPTA